MNETRWLDPDEQRAWRAFLGASQLLFERLERQLQRDAGLSHADYEILARLSQAGGQRLRMSELASCTLFSRSRLSHAVARLEREGMVRRQRCPSDGRGTFAVLTPRGRNVLTGAAPAHVEEVRRQVFDHLTPAQVHELRRISDAIRSRLD
ncbi:MAG TPA: MarR family transcriptional regulator, partial [Actinomycetes bacterium]|nr:MarR family transcriptional regulator [Actinomycetes bacterium]